MSRRDAQLASAIARWIGARANVGARVVRIGEGVEHDPLGPACDVRLAGETIEVRGTAAAARELAQQLLGGPPELAAPRPLTAVEHALWALAVARATRDAGIACEVWPRVEAAGAPPAEAIGVELAVELPHQATTVVAYVPPSLALRPPPSLVHVPAWRLELPIVVARCALPSRAAGSLAVGDLVTVERALELDVLGGSLVLAAATNAVVAEVVSGYVPRDVSLPDDAHVELTVALGTTRLSLREVCDLAIGQIVQLGRPLAGPFEVRAAGRLVGRGELVDVDGELAVRIVSLERKE